MYYTKFITRNYLASALVVTGLVFGTGTASYFFLPKLEYLPEGNKNLVFGVLIPPPGYNLKTTSGIAEKIESQIKPYFILNEGGDKNKNDYPRINNFFFVSTSTRIFIGASTEDPNKIKKIIPLMEKAAFQEAGTLGFVNQPSIFGRTAGGSRKIDLNISGSDLNNILEIAILAVVFCRTRKYFEEI